MKSFPLPWHGPGRLMSAQGCVCESQHRQATRTTTNNHEFMTKTQITDWFPLPLTRGSLKQRHRRRQSTDIVNSCPCQGDLWPCCLLRLIKGYSSCKVTWADSQTSSSFYFLTPSSQDWALKDSAKYVMCPTETLPGEKQTDELFRTVNPWQIKKELVVLPGAHRALTVLV